jgi:transcriptional regulator GlxA family with amidase domain
MKREQAPYRVSLVAIPEAMTFTLNGLFEVFGSFGLLSAQDPSLPRQSPFAVEIVAAQRGISPTASGLPVLAHAGIDEVARTDLVIVPSVMVDGGEWRCHRHEPIVRWLQQMHREGATLCSACSGLLLLAETGLLAGHEATMHWAYEQTFRRSFPDVQLRLEETIVVAGERQQFVMSGAAMAWHDLVLYLITRYAGPAAAQAIARFFAMQWHDAGQSPYIAFAPRTGHGDAIVADAQLWLERNFSAPNPVDEIVKRCGIPERSFKRRFTAATGRAPIEYVQSLRVECAKRRLEQSDQAIDALSWDIGYEDAAAFRRLFKRVVGVTPGAYRRKYRVPAQPRPSAMKAGPHTRE